MCVNLYICRYTFIDIYIYIYICGDKWRYIAMTRGDVDGVEIASHCLGGD